MKADFWHQKWESNDIAFHAPKPNPLLVAHWGALQLPVHSRVFVPLCGKSLDVAWLLAQGHRVVAAELSRMAIEQLFAELGLAPTIVAHGALEHFSAPNLNVFVGDVFALSSATLGPVDAVYDRAALVAMPDGMRSAYAAHISNIAQGAPQLLISFTYDQNQMEGPPFSVPATEVAQHYSTHYNVASLASTVIRGGLKGRCEASEDVWLLQRRA